MADLAVWQRTIVDEEGNVIPGAEIEVRREEDDSLATLYADRAGETPLANPMAADMSGFVRFFTQGDAYTITAVGAGSTRTWRFDPTGRLQEFDRVSEALVADDAADLLSARSNLGTFSSVADVENSHIPPVLDSIRTNGYYEPSDGGGAQYYRKLVLESDAPGDIEDASGERFGLVRGQRVTVKAFGAKGDGVSDDSAAFQAALLYSAAATGTIIVPEGDYVLGSKVAASLGAARTGFALVAEHPNSARIIVANSDGGFDLDISQGRGRVIIKNLAFIARAPGGGSAGTAIKITGDGTGSGHYWGCQLEDLFLTADIDDLTGSYFSRCIDMEEVARPFLSNVRGTGRYGPSANAPDWFAMQYGVRAYNCYGPYFEQVRFWSVDTGFYVEHVDHEGLSMFNCGTGGNTLYGAQLIGNGRSLGDLIDCYFDSYGIGVRVNNAINTRIINSMFWHSDFSDTENPELEPTEYYDIKLENVRQALIDNPICRFENLGPTTYGIHLGASCKDCVIRNPYIKSRHYGVWDHGQNTFISDGYFLDCVQGVRLTTDSVGARVTQIDGTNLSDGLIENNSTSASVRLLNQPGVSARLSANQSISDSSSELVKFDTLVGDDPLGWFDSSTGAFTVPEKRGIGYIDVLVGIAWQSNATGYRVVKVMKNGSAFALQPFARTPAVSNSQLQAVGRRIPVNGGDVITVEVEQSSGGALNVLSNNATYVTITPTY